MEAQIPAAYSLPPDISHHVLRHLSKWDKQQFALCCKHTYLCALAAVRSLLLTHKCLNTAKPLRMKTMKHCSSMTLRPRTMDELTDLAALLLVHNMHHFPSLTALRLEMLNVYDKQCDVSLIIKSVALHGKQLTQLHIEQEAQLSLKAMAAVAELPLLERLTVKSRNGFEPGALGQLSRAVNLTSLHLETLSEASGSTSTASQASPISPSAAAAACASGPAKSPSELARLQAADEVGLGKMGTQLLTFTGAGFSTPSTLRPITALLAAVAGSPKPRLAELQLGGLEVSAQMMNLISSITSLSNLKLLPGCDLASPLDLARLSGLAGLTQLLVAPVMPPAPVLAAWAKGCKRLSSLGVCGQPGPLPLTPSMTSVTHLQLLPSASASRSRHGSSTGTDGAGSGAGRLSVDLGSLAITLRSPLSLSGLESLWPNLVSLEVVGWALDAASITAIKQHSGGLSSIRLQGGREPGTALHARLLLPLLDKPGLQRLVLTELSDLTDIWVGEALLHVTGPCTDGSLTAVRELHLGAAPEGASTAQQSTAAASSSSSTAAREVSFSGSSGGSSDNSSRMLTDKGLMKLVAWPRLTSLTLTGLPGITLAGVKALVAGSHSLAELTLSACPALAAAPADSISRAAVGPGGRAVDLWVS